MRIKKGSEVTFHYELRNEKGDLLDSTFGGEPVHYVHGEGEIVEGLEEFLEGEEPGFEAKVEIPPEKGYGTTREDLIVYASPENFDDQVEIKIGEVVETEDPEGNMIQFRIVEVDEDKVYLDGNHPLANQTLEYRVEVVEVA
ncbi:MULTISPECIES: FKBP-type peptidyl-prolyl cis-trans isomerase [Piscirickettsiaceae]|jgi:FKBP-type peptidyl-prolyl cis-trans isomerase SlyD|uniref:Peptidyl-prolyl cis-trans isomerase n=1 Tax=Hydrogenovibrio thermophilus TaxID=265883 RepID=A0A410H2I0_9GAMM|nr:MULTISPECIES: FKBP-type peptidyl-prolyl cis-trans isomerase [Piscirickettsiaceae]AZR82354.1 peptidylprolyl isomerase [Thiomicrospira sp. S5]QAB15106.1 peptidylprolyl isomerase [Hydrogenovibrio thermophilus]